MKYIFTLKDGNTIINYNENFEWEDQNLMLFQWLENNYSCDCNRRLFMYNDFEATCGDEVELLKITDIKGRIIYEK
jgi:hypothetical protein